MLKLVVNNAAKDTQPEAGATHEAIDKATITRLSKESKGSELVVYDTELPGFRLRRTPAGSILFLYVGRIRGGEGANKNKLVKRTLGPAIGADALPVAKARALALALREQLAKGIDPADELRAKADAAEALRKEDERKRELQLWTPAYALTHMLEWRASRPDTSLHFKPETVEFYQRGIGYLGKLASVPIVELRADDIRKALDKVGGVAKPAKAKRALSGVIAHTIKRLELNIANPVSRLDRGEFKAPAARTSYIAEGDVGAFVEKALKLPTLPTSLGKEREMARARDYLLLALLYGTRKEELMRMEWSWIDWDRQTVTLPASVTKQKKVHVLPLTPWTHAILKRRFDARKPEVPFVFPGQKKGQPLTNIRRSLVRAYGEGFKLHDFRRTLITHCASLGIHGSRLKAIVGHARSGVTEGYDQREIEQVRRDLSTYHRWVADQHELATRFKDQAEAIDAEREAEQEKARWPGV